MSTGGYCIGVGVRAVVPVEVLHHRDERLHLGGEGPPRELDRYGTLVHDLEVLMGEESDGCRLGVDMALGEVDVVVVGLADDGDLSLEPIVLQCELVLVLAGLLRHK